jgi:hypothetical protein
MAREAKLFANLSPVCQNDSMIPERLKNYGPVAAFLVLIAAGFLFFRAAPSPSVYPDIFVPAGWYLHHSQAGSVILTRQKELPNVGNTETLAYGEQITLEILRLDRPLDAWIAWRIPDGDPTVLSKEHGSIDGHQALRVEQETEGGRTLDYYIFAADRIYVFTLYPLKSSGIASQSSVTNTADIQALGQVIKDFVTKV